MCLSQVVKQQSVKTIHAAGGSVNIDFVIGTCHFTSIKVVCGSGFSYKTNGINLLLLFM